MVCFCLLFLFKCTEIMCCRASDLCGMFKGMSVLLVSDEKSD
uniref:Uncharacterized protein n=1 Tax=Anguilla anguilla TaxID=7936 RepID=A0A0E9XRZ9_ANGAN